MSRHRNIRQMLDDYYEDDDEYDDDDDDDDFINSDDHQASQQERKPVIPMPKKNQATVGSKKKVSQSASKPSQSLKGRNINSPALKKAATASPTPAAEKVTSVTVTTLAPVEAATVGPPPPPGFHTLSGSMVSSPNHQPTETTATLTAPSPPPPPPDLLNATASSKTLLTVVVLGHVDAGKSTLAGQLLFATTTSRNNKSSNNNNMKKPTNFAYLCDEDDAERSHGITMDIATKMLETARYSIVLQDAPGHVDFIPAMITGTSHADAALLVVDVTDLSTALLHGQLREHVWLMRGMGVNQVVVALSKMDVVQYEERVFDSTCSKIQAFLVRVGFARNKIRFVPVSGLSGSNIAHADPMNMNWYYERGVESVTLLVALDNYDPPPALSFKLNRPLRIVITDVVGEQGRGVAVRGKVIQGWVGSGESLSILPIGDTTTLQKLSSFHQQQHLQKQQQQQQSFSSSSVSSPKYVPAGEVIDCILPGVDISRISIGSILSRPVDLPSLSARCQCQLWVLESLTLPIVCGTQGVFHISHVDVPCYVAKLLQVSVKNAAPRLRPKTLTANSTAQVEIVLSNPTVMESFSECRALGRFVLRRSGESIAVGRIEHVLLCD